MNCPSCRAPNRDDAEACFTCGRALHALILGTVLAERYEILQPLGQGGMGTVYKARDRVLEEDVAIKVLRPDIARDPLLARRFRSEIKLARRVTHRNVCRIHEYGEDGALRYISMQYIDGVDLRTILQSTSLERTEAFGVALQVALGLHAVHDIGIIHRDLKSSNVMIDAKGVARLLDFGIAKEMGADTTGFTVAGKLFGTPEYMSPEHARGSEVDFRSDIYSLGCLVYEIFTRRVPFHGENAAATIVKHLQEPPSFGSLIPEPLAPVLRKALAKEPADRYSEVGELIQALDLARQAHEPELPPAAVEDDQRLTRPIQDKDRPVGWGGSTYGSVWRQTHTGRMVPVPQPLAFSKGTRHLASFLRLRQWRDRAWHWGVPLVRAWRWAIPIVLLASAAVAGRQVLSRPLERDAFNEPPTSPAPPSSAAPSSVSSTSTLPPAVAVFAPPSSVPLPVPSAASTTAPTASLGPGPVRRAALPSPSAAAKPPESTPAPTRKSPSPAVPRSSTPPWTLVAAITKPSPSPSIPAPSPAESAPEMAAAPVPIKAEGEP